MNSLNKVTPTEEAFTFIYASLVDIQGTIRAVDTKLSAVIAIEALAAPFAMPLLHSHLLHHAACQSQSSLLIPTILYAFAVFSFFVSIWMAIYGIVGISNPRDKITSSHDTNGAFYSPGMFSLRAIDALHFVHGDSSLPTLERHLQTLPMARETVFRELAFEQMKLCYIRDIKLLRQRFAFNALTFGLVACLLLISWSSIGTSLCN